MCGRRLIAYAKFYSPTLLIAGKSPILFQFTPFRGPEILTKEAVCCNIVFLGNDRYMGAHMTIF